MGNICTIFLFSQLNFHRSYLRVAKQILLTGIVLHPFSAFFPRTHTHCMGETAVLLILHQMCCITLLRAFFPLANCQTFTITFLYFHSIFASNQLPAVLFWSTFERWSFSLSNEVDLSPFLCLVFFSPCFFHPTAAHSTAFGSFRPTFMTPTHFSSCCVLFFFQLLLSICVCVCVCAPLPSSFQSPPPPSSFSLVFQAHASIT